MLKQKCRICSDYDKSDRGLLFFDRRKKLISKFSNIEDALIKACNCEIVHKFCILKLILEEQSNKCKRCNQTYSIDFVEKNDSFCLKLYYFRVMKEIILILLLILISIGLMILNGIYEYTKAYYFWKVIVFVIFGLFIFFGLIFLIRIIRRIQKEKYLSNIVFPNHEYPQESNLAHVYNQKHSNMDGLKKNLMLIVKDFAVNTLDKVECKNNLELIMSTLMSDFKLSKKEIIQLKIDNKNMQILSRPKDYSLIISPPDECLSINKTMKNKGTFEDMEILRLRTCQLAITNIENLEKVNNSLNQAKSKREELTITITKTNQKNAHDTTDNLANNITQDIPSQIQKQKQQRISTHEVIDRLYSDNSVDGKDLVLYISDDDSFKKSNQMDDFQDSMVYLNSKENLIK